MATILPRWATLRYVIPLTNAPRRTRPVTAAMCANVVALSSIGSHGRPIDGICRKWSMTQSESKPAASAAFAKLRTRGPSSSEPPGHTKLGICSPKRNAGRLADGSGARLAAARAEGAATPAANTAGTTRTGAGASTSSNPSAARRSRTAGQARSCASSTATGTRSARARFRSRRTPAGASKATATHGIPDCRAAASQRPRRSGSSPRVSMTVVSRRFSLRSTTCSSNANASVLAAMSYSPSPTRARSRSLDTI